jgi:hypothetical protein
MIQLPLLLALVGCGRNATEADVKMAGVGLNPDEIGPAPEDFGGLIELDYVDFAGGGLSLAALGLQSYDEVGPGFVSFKPPYAAVYALAFIFDDLVPAPDAHHGSIGIPPTVDDACWTTYEPFSYLMASTVELGDEIRVHNADDSVELTVGRVPELYPPDPQDIFVYYSAVESYVATPMTHWVPSEEGGFEEATLRARNWGFGEEVSLSFMGGIPPLEAPVSSIPRPSASVGDPSIILPDDPGDVSLAWEGPVYQSGTGLVEESGSWQTCISYLGSASRSNVGNITGAHQKPLCERRANMPTDTSVVPGQMYTGPWDTEDGTVTFEWEPGSGDDGGYVALNIRFLGPVDRTSDGFLVQRVPVDAPENIVSQWDNLVSDGTVEGDVPQGYRWAQACETDEDFEYVFDTRLETSDGGLIDTLQGDPTYNLVEVSCRLADDGEFTLSSSAHLARALEYAHSHEAGGAIFYFSRSTEAEASVPPVKDQAGFKRQISPIKLRANAVKVGRFWLEDPSDLASGN